MLDLQLEQTPDQPLPLLQLYDRISSRAISPSRAPPSDAVQRCRDLTDWLRDTLVSVGVSNHQAHHTPTNNNVQAEMRELATILMKPHFKVGHASLIVDAYSKSLHFVETCCLLSCNCCCGISWQRSEWSCKFN
jgi:hypothetical protein